jgi:hypothetical protein
MKIAYLILAHSNPRLIKKAVDCLACEGATFFIHIDAKFPLDPFAPIRGEKIIFIEPRLPVYWGEFSQTEAIFLLMRQALAAPQGHDYFVLMSGSDFPLRSGRYVRDYLAANQGSEFISMIKLPGPGMPISRINTIRFPSTQPVRRFLFRALAKIGLAQRDYRKHLGNLEPYSGHTWWALSRAACEYIFAMRQQRPELAKFYQHTHASDETLIHTLLGNSPFKSKIRRHLVFEDWHSPAAHPEMINPQHLEYFESQNEVVPRDANGPGEMLFARKFSDTELHLAERVVAMIARKENLPHLKAT